MTDRPSVPQVSVIKVKIHEATGMPAGKQKLQYEVSWVSAVLVLSVVPEAKSFVGSGVGRLLVVAM